MIESNQRRAKGSGLIIGWRSMVRTMALALAVTSVTGISAVSGQTGGATDSKPRTIAGVVKSFSRSSFVLDVGGGEMVFAITPTTRHIGKGPPSDLVVRDPKEVTARWFAQRVTRRDRVKVTFRPAEGVLNAVEIRVRLQSCAGPPRETSRHWWPSTYASARRPSCFSSNSQSGWSNGSGIRTSDIGRWHSIPELKH